MKKSVVFIGDTKWEVSIKDNIIKLKTDGVIDEISVEGIFQVIFELSNTNGNPSVQSNYWHIKEIFYGEKALNAKDHFEIIFNSLVNNSFVNGSSYSKGYSTYILKKPKYEKSFVSIVAEALKGPSVDEQVIKETISNE